MDAKEAAAMDPAQQAPIGHNRPPEDVPTQEEIIRSRLEGENISLLARQLEIMEAVERAPATVEDDDTAGKVSDFVKQIAACIKNSNAARVAAKEPYLNGGRAVDGFFKAVSDPLDKAKRNIEGRLSKYLRQKADAERLKREEEALRAMTLAAAKMDAMQDDSDLDAAVAAEADAQKAARETAAKAAEMSRTRGDYGAVASLRTTWDFDSLDRAALDLEALRPHLPGDALEKAVRSWIKANAANCSDLKEGKQPVKGVRIFENTNAVVR